MKKSKFFPLIVTGLILLAVLTACQSSKNTSGKTLKFNYEKGKGYDYEMVIDLTQNMMGKENTMSLTSGYSIEVVNDEGDVKTFQSAFRDFQVHMNMAGMEIDVDSGKPYTDTTATDYMDINKLMNHLFRGMKGKVFTMKVNSEGHVMEVLGLEKIFEEMFRSMNMPEAIKQQMQATAKGQFNGQNIKDQFEQIFFIFPGKEVNVGNSWKKTYKAGSSVPGSYETTYTVKEIEGHFTTLGVKTNIKSDHADLDMNGTQEGSMLIDSRSGLVVNSDLQLDMKAEVNGMTMVMKGKSKVKGSERD